MSIREDSGVILVVMIIRRAGERLPAAHENLCSGNIHYTMVIMGAYTALRINDLLRLKWSDVYNEERQAFLKYLSPYFYPSSIPRYASSRSSCATPKYRLPAVLPTPERYIYLCQQP